MRVICDIETNQLEIDDNLQIWCIVCKDIDTGTLYKFAPGYLSKNDFKQFAKNIELWWGHNFISFDAPVLKAILNIDIPVKQIRDTLILSQLFKYKREYGHSLKGWGLRLGKHKEDFNSFDKYSIEMLRYCIQDVEVTDAVRKELLREGKEFSSKAIQIEHEFQYIMHKQETNGFPINERKTHELLVKCKGEADKLEEDILKFFPPILKFKKEYRPRLVSDGSRFAANSCGPIKETNGSYSLLEVQEFNLRSPKQIVERLDPYWRPTIKTKSKQSWKICEENLATLDKGVPKSVSSLARWLTLNSRVNTINNWLDNLKNDGCVHGKVFPLATKTHRCSHNSPNIANIPAILDRQGKEQLYGKECREVWSVHDRENYRLLGTDASGIQLRIFAHYIGNLDYIDEVINGDIHTKNMEALGGLCKSRPTAKTFIYAWLLGASTKKIAEILGCSNQEAGEAEELFIESIPGLRELLYRKTQAARRGYMIALDGRKIALESDHQALSVYLQSGEAITMKLANILWDRRATKIGIDYSQCAFVHDEWQTQVETMRAEELGMIQVAAIKRAGELLKVKCPLDGEFKIGLTWKDTH